MENKQEPDVKDVGIERVPDESDIDDDEVITPDNPEGLPKTDEEKDATPPSSEEKEPAADDAESEPKGEGESDESERQTESEKPGTPPVKQPKKVEGETPRETALRIQIEVLRKANRQEKAKEVFGSSQPVQQQKLVQQEDPRKKEILSKYKPEEVESLKELMGVFADDMGFVKKDEYNRTTYQSQADGILNEFLDQHPEYSAENDKDDILWNRFKDEVGMYKAPGNPKDYKRLFDKIHREIFSVQSDDSSLLKIKAGQEKIKVASHSGAAPTKSSVPKSKNEPAVDPSLAKKYLKGFDDEEIDEIVRG